MAAATSLGVLNFQEKIQGGVRPNLFEVSLDFPTGIDAAKDSVAYLCKSASLPATTVGTVELPFRGRVIKVPGDRTFESWTATFYNTDSWELRSAFEKWISVTNAVDANVSESSLKNVLQKVTISQMDKFSGDKTAKIIREYKLFKAFPVSVSQISVAFDNNDSYEEFDVEFAYQYFTSTGGLGKNESTEVVG
tara:strand:+ start:187 stop:765 length:579 start_codon:yes stop_codon:yes gene_type:complete